MFTATIDIKLNSRSMYFATFSPRYVNITTQQFLMCELKGLKHGRYGRYDCAFGCRN